MKLTYFRDLWKEIKKEKVGLLTFMGVFLNTLIRNGFIISFGITIAAFRGKYTISLAKLYAIGSFPTAFGYVFSLVPGLIHKKHQGNSIMLMFFGGTILQIISCLASSFIPNPNWLFLTYSLVYGLGNMFSNMPTVLILNLYFPYDHKFHSILFCLYNFAFTLGSTIFAYLLNWLITTWSWNDAMRAIALIHLLFCLPITYLLKLSQKENKEDEVELKKDFDQPNFNTFTIEDDTKTTKTAEEVNFSNEGKKKETIELFYWAELYAGIKHRPESILWYINCFFIACAIFMPFYTLPYYLSQKNFDEVNPAQLIGFLTAGEVLVYFIAFLLANWIKGKLVYLFLGCTGLCVIVNVSWTYIDHSLEIVCIQTFVMGMTIGLLMGYFYVSCSDICEIKLETNLPICSVFLGSGAMATPIISGLVYDMRNSFRDLFFSIGIMGFIQFILIISIIAIKQRRKYNESKL